MGMVRIWRTAFTYHVNGVGCATVINVKADSSSSIANISAGDVADNVVDWLKDSFLAQLSTRDKLDAITLTEELGPGSAIPAVAERSGTWPGTRYGATWNMDNQICAWVKTKTNAAVRGGHGGFFGSPALDEACFNTDEGKINHGNAYYAAIAAFAADLLEGHDVGALGVDGHLSYVIYSRTRRMRGDSNYYFDATSCTISERPHFLRSRKS